MKKALALFLSLLLTLSLSACTGGSDTSSQPVDVLPGEEIAPSVYVQNSDEVFEEGTTIKATPVTEGKAFNTAKEAVKDVAEKIAVYDMTAVKDNAQVQPDGKLKVTFRLPEDFSTNVTVYYVADDGSREALATQVNPDARTVSAQLAHFSLYVLADAGEEATTTTAGDTTTTTTEAVTTTKVPDTTKKLTTTTKKPTTKAPSYSAFADHNWIARKVITEGDGKFCHSWELVLTEKEQRMGESSASPYEEMVPPEHRDQEPPEFEFDGIQWYSGSGGGGAITSVKEKDNTITITGEDGGTLVLVRTGEKTAKVKSCGSEIITIADGTVFTIAE